jgi:hypothetical protein
MVLFSMKFSSLLSLIALVSWSGFPVMANPVLSSHPCEDTGSTGLTYECFQNELRELDDELKTLLHRVPATASDIPSQEFRDLWMEHLEQEDLNRSNVTQLLNFQEARRAYCLYVNSLSFQGTGYGSMVLKCEIEITKAALQNEI